MNEIVTTGGVAVVGDVERKLNPRIGDLYKTYDGYLIVVAVMRAPWYPEPAPKIVLARLDEDKLMKYTTDHFRMDYLEKVAAMQFVGNDEAILGARS